MMKRKGAIGIPFAWLFAIIVGAFILFLAIFATVKITDTQRLELDASTAKEIGILLNPLETGFETGKSTSMILPSETRIYNRCEFNGGDAFGKQILRLSQKSLGEWSEPVLDISFGNKYIFSDGFEEGRKFYIFSKPFDFPYKVSDLIYITSSEKIYCFDEGSTPSEIKNEISNLNQGNLFTEDCPRDSIEVCFNGNCDIEVNRGSRYVDKSGERMYFYSDALMYAAIFSEPEVYECQLKRVVKRTINLADIYIDKNQIVSAQGCASNLDSDLLGIKSSLTRFTTSTNLNQILINDIENLQSKNDRAECKLW